MNNSVLSQSRPACAILLAAYNGMRFLPEQIRSILNQVNVSITLFVSIDASEDGTEAWFVNLAQSDSRVILLPLGKKFGGAAKNFFRLVMDVDFSPYDYVALSDQDDIWMLNKLDHAIHYMITNELSAYSSNVTAFWENGKQRIINKAQQQKAWDFIFEAAGPGCTYVMSLDLIKEIQKCIVANKLLIQKVSLHDWFFYAYARAKDYKWGIDSYSGLLYRQHNMNQVGVNSGVKAYLQRFKKIYDGWWFSQACLISSIIGLKNCSVVEYISKNRLGALKLTILSFKCRRKFSEQLIFMGACLMLSLSPSMKKNILNKVNLNNE